MSDATLIADLIRAGVDPGLVNRVAVAIFNAMSATCPVESPVDKTAEKRRAFDRERKRAQRMSGGKSGGSPVDFPPETLARVEENITSSSPRGESKKEEKKETTSRGKTIPPDWQPTEKHFALALQLGQQPEWVRQVADVMREWAGANRNRGIARKSDWDLTFNGFLRREARKSTGPPRSAFPPTFRDQQKQRAQDAYDELKAHNRSRNGSSGAPAGVLPAGIGERSENLHHRNGRDPDDLFDPDDRAIRERGSGPAEPVQISAKPRGDP